MEEEKAGASGGGDGDGGGGNARVSSSFVAVGGRQSFAVELRPGETTIVSWKKLVKDASKVKRPSSAAPEPPPSVAHAALESHIPPVSVGFYRNWYYVLAEIGCFVTVLD